MENNRSLLIEQTRGIAVALVLLYHYTARIPYTSLGASEPAAFEFYGLGRLGVYIFFILSGFLIAQSLDKCSSLGEFYIKRITRIWPLFILASTVIFIWLQLIHSVPHIPNGPNKFDVSERIIIDLVGNFFFLKDLGFKWIDGAFWSILVELKFYFLIGIFAASYKEKYTSAFIRFSCIICIIESAIKVIDANANHIVVQILHGIFITQYLPFFCIGIILYKKKYDLWFIICCIFSFRSVVDSSFEKMNGHIEGTFTALCLFASVIFIDQVIGKGKFFSFIGKYSYSIYLFHQVIGLSLIMMLAPQIGMNLSILIVMPIIIAISYVASHAAEWRFRKKLTGVLGYIIKLTNLNKVYLHYPHSHSTEKNKGPIHE